MKNIRIKKPTFDLRRSDHSLATIGQEYPLELMRTDPRTALITLALMFSNSDPMRVHGNGLAASQLALFAAAPFACVDAEQYEQLRNTVTIFRDYCLQLRKQPPTQNRSSHIDQADRFSFYGNRWHFNPLDTRFGSPSDYNRMVQMLNFILSESEGVFELEQVKRSVQKQLNKKNRPSKNSRRRNVFEIDSHRKTNSHVRLCTKAL